MSLRDKLNEKIAAAWAKFDDVPVDGIVKHLIAQSYDPVTGPGELWDDYPCQIILDTISEAEQEDTELSGKNGEYNALIPLDQLPIIPAIGDMIVINGKEYNIIHVLIDPARVLFTGQIVSREAVDNGLG